MKALPSLDDRRIDNPDLGGRSGVPVKDPRKAAGLSIVPGLGQLYNGEKGKGLLFLSVFAANLLLLIPLLGGSFLRAQLDNIARPFGWQLQWQYVDELVRDTSFVCAAAIYVALLLSFIAYAAREAYDHAALSRLGTTFNKYYLGLTELTSGSYLVHFAVTASFFVLVLFVVMPKPPSEQVTQIELVAPPPPPPPPPPPKAERPKPPAPRVETAKKVEVKPQPKPDKPPPQPVVQEPLPVATVPAPAPLETAPGPPADAAPAATGTSSGGEAPAAGGGESQEVDFTSYVAQMQKRIKKAWFPPKGNESKRITVKFKLDRQGNVSGIRLEKSSGLSIADDAAIAAVEQAAPFGTLPSGAPDKVEIRFTFDYNVFNGGRSVME